MKKNSKKRIYLFLLFAAIAIVAGTVLLFIFIPFEKNKQQATQEKILFDDEFETILEDSIAELSDFENLKGVQDESGTRGNNKTAAPQEEFFAEEELQMQPLNAKAVVGNLFEMVRPARTPLVINCKNLNKTFDFQWNTNAESVEVTLKDKKGRILLAREISQTGLQLRYEDYYKYLEVFWEMKAIFEDGTAEEKKGVLQMLVDD